MILVFGSINVDLVARVATIAGPGMTVLARSHEQHFGGKGANQAVAAARLSAPGTLVMAACVGADAFGRDSTENLGRNGVSTELVRVCDTPTGCAFISVDAQAENAITVASGANGALSAGDVPDAMLRSGTVLVLQMEVPFPASLDVARRTRQAGGRVIWNCAPVPPAMTGDEATALLEASDILVVNEHEASDIALILGVAADDIAQLATRSATTCIVTAGARGAFAYTADGQVCTATTPAIVPVDTTGAGDTFVGAIAVALHEGSPLADALRFGCKAAALSCLSAGAQGGMPVRDALHVVRAL
ncbi:ribokinase [Bosea sp. 2YAB26]|uniref:ribokinase n=1 Tax=Bosea sp. 2YAB26 TaxID=3237478 RepID=UPI003F928548